MAYGIICNNNSSIVIPVTRNISNMENIDFYGQKENLPLITIVSGRIQFNVSPNRLMITDASLEETLNLAAGLVSSTGAGVVTYYDTTKDMDQSKDNKIDKIVYHVDQYGGLNRVTPLNNAFLKPKNIQ